MVGVMLRQSKSPVRNLVARSGQRLVPAASPAQDTRLPPAASRAVRRLLQSSQVWLNIIHQPRNDAKVDQLSELIPLDFSDIADLPSLLASAGPRSEPRIWPNTRVEANQGAVLVSRRPAVSSFPRLGEL